MWCLTISGGQGLQPPLNEAFQLLPLHGGVGLKAILGQLGQLFKGYPMLLPTQRIDPLFSEMIQYGPDRDHPNPGAETKPVATAILSEPFAPPFEKSQKNGIVQIFKIKPVERNLLGQQGVLNSAVNKI